MSYYGELIAFCTTLSWSIGVFPFTQAARRFGPDAVNHIRLLFALIMLTAVFAVQHSFSVSGILDQPEVSHWIWFGLSGIVGLSLGDYFGFTAFAILGTRIGSLFTCFAPGAALLFGFILLGESISLIGIIGIAITAAGVMYLSLSKEEKERTQNEGYGNFTKGVVFGILSAVCQGIGLVFSKKGMSETQITIDPIHATWIRMLVAAIVLYFITVVRGNFKKINKPVLENRNQGMRYVLAGTLFGPVIGVCFSMYAVSMVNVSIAQTIFSLVPVFVLPLALVLTKEPINTRSVVGAAVAISGVLILVWRESLSAFIGF